MVTSRNVSLLPLLLCAGGLVGCSSGSHDEEGDLRIPEIVVLPDEAVVPQGSSIVVRVDVTGGNNEGLNGYEIELDEVQSKIDIRTAPCPANLGRAACQDWTIAPAGDSLPGHYYVRLRSVGLRAGVARGSFSLRVVQSPTASYGPALAVLPDGVRSRNALVMIADGRIVSYGGNAFAQLGHGYRQQEFAPDSIANATPAYISAFVPVRPGPDLGPEPVFISASLGDFASYAASEDGSVWHWGSREHARGGERTLVTDPDFILRLNPAPIEGPAPIRFVSTNAASTNTLAVDRDGAVWSWGCASLNEFCDDDDAQPRLLDITGVRTALATYSTDSLFLMQDGRVVGSNRRTPVAGLPGNIVKIAANRVRGAATEAFLALDRDGGVWTWTSRGADRTPTRFAALADATDVAVDFQNNLYAVRRGSSSLWMWRLNDPSQTREIAAPPGDSFVKVAPGHAILNDCRADGGSIWRIQPTANDSLDNPTALAAYEVEVLPEFGVGGGSCPAAPTDVAPLTVSVQGAGRMVSEPAGIDCTSSCTHEFRRGAFVFLNAVADPGWRVSSIQPEGCSQLPGDTSARHANVVRRIIAGAVTECRAVFVESSPLEMRLTVEVSPGGSVRSDPSGIACGELAAEYCSHWFNTGVDVTLTPRAQSGYRFDGFGGDPDCEDGTVDMSSGRLCHARFSQLTPSAPLPNTGEVLTVQMLGSGTVTGPEINCPEDCTEEYPFNTVVTLEATPAPGWGLVRWIDGCDEDPDNRCIVRVVGTQTVVVEFSPIVPQSTLRVTVNGSGSGTVTSSPSGIVCGADCEEEFDTGEFVTLTATPAQGHFFAGWSGCDSPCEFALDASREVTATFEPLPSNGLFELSVEIQGPGRVLTGAFPLPGGIDCNEETQPTDCAAQFAVGSLIEIQALPTSNWLGSGRPATFIGWSGDSHCDALGAQSNGLIPMNRNVRCIARFQAPNLHLVRFSVTGAGTVTNDPPRADGSGLLCREGLFGGPCQANLGMPGTLRVRATPDFGMLFVGWGGDCASYGAARNANIVVTDNMNCTATFAQATTPTTLTVAMQRGSPTRVIESEPAGILCFDGAGAVCAADFQPGTTVILRSTLANTVWENCDEVFTVPIQFHECRMNLDQTDKFVLAVFPPL